MTRINSYLVYFILAAFLATFGVLLIDRAMMRKELRELKCKALVADFVTLTACLEGK